MITSSSGRAGLAATLVVASLLTATAQAQWAVSTYLNDNNLNNGGNSQGALQNYLAGYAPNSGGSTAVLYYTDPGPGGANNSGDNFGVYNPFPGSSGSSQTDNYAVYANGVMNVTTAGSFTFRTASDDSSRLVVDGRNVNVYNACCGQQDATIALSAGAHAVQWNYQDGGGGSGGQLEVAYNGGAFALLGDGSFTQASISTNLPGPVSGSFAPGLNGTYYASPYNGGNASDNQNATTDAYLAGNPAAAGTFLSTTVNYHGGNGDINAHLGADSASLTGGGTNTTPGSVFTFSGELQVKVGDDIDPLAPGIQIAFRNDSDDNSRLSIGGLSILENDGSHGTNHFYSDNADTLASGTGDNAAGTTIVTFGTPGFYALSYYYHNGNGGDDGELLSSIGVNLPVNTGGIDPGSLAVIGADRLFHIVPEPSSFVLAALAGLGLIAMARRRRATG